MASDAEPEQTMRVDLGASRTVGPRRALRIVLVTVLALIVTAGVLVFIPRSYESSARLIVEAAGNAADINARIASQVELIRSRDLLVQVAEEGGLRSLPDFANPGFSPVGSLMRLVGLGDKRSADEIVLANLAERTTVAREGQSAVISITVRAGDPQLAAKIANRMARSHVDGWAARQAADSAGAATRLEQEIEALKAKVSAADGAVASYRIEHGLADAAMLPATGAMTETAAEIAQAQQRRNDAEAKGRVIRGLLATGEPLNGVAELGNSAVMALLMQSRATLSAELTQKQTTLLPNHPTIRALKAQIEQVDGQIRGEAEKIATSLEAEARIAAEHEKSLRDAAAAERTAAGDAVASAVSLEGLEREAKAQRDLLDSYQAKYAELVAANNSAGPRQDIRIISEAAPASEPASPQYLLVLGGVGLAVLAGQVALALIGQASFTPVRETEAVPQAERPLDEMPEPPAGGDFVEAEADDLVAAEADAVADEGYAEEEEQQDGAVPADPFETPVIAAEAETIHAIVVEDDLVALSDELMAQQQRIVLLAGVGATADTLPVIERVLEDTIMDDLSAVVVDAASGTVTPAVGLTDLAAGTVDYGDVLKRIGDNLAEVPWGQLGALDLQSPRPLTLVEALAEIYHIVVVDTGNVHGGLNLAAFAGANATVVVVPSPDTPAATVEAALQEIAALGFASSRVVHLAPARAEVA